MKCFNRQQHINIFKEHKDIKAFYPLKFIAFIGIYAKCVIYFMESSSFTKEVITTGTRRSSR